ncbi:Fic family protein [Adlercreutzia sp. ZJ242]|uniref:Fic family protein n=1 Tax=Adlercreutzia sp. ZJ242 TaxID=2709409 RepID=UPI0019812CF0|nr:Fic family protein [Adlercreutzia sp. ZJ242]
MEFLPAAAIARLWGVSERSVRNYCAQGRVPGAFRTGRMWSIPADAEKPMRPNARNASSGNPLLARLLKEKESGIRGGIYHKLQVEFTYNSNHIEGSRLSLDQTRLIFETSSISDEGRVLAVNDIIETVNHFRCIDLCLGNARKPLSEHLIKELHRTLKAGTSDSSRPWFSVGEYKQVPNEVGGRPTSAPEDVSAHMTTLIREYDPLVPHSLDQIIDFHVRLERIHPFQDGNGRVGRLIMLKECLGNGVVPFVITDDMKLFYYRGLAEWDDERGFLTDTCLAAQDRFGRWMDYFRIPPT